MQVSGSVPASRSPSSWVNHWIPWSISTVAWQLIDATAPYLSADQRTIVFVELGCGEHHRATERILAAVIEVSFPLSAALLATLTTWLDLYTRSPEEHRLRTLLAAIAPT
jgi:hypothetical protein